MNCSTSPNFLHFPQQVFSLLLHFGILGLLGCRAGEDSPSQLALLGAYNAKGFVAGFVRLCILAMTCIDRKDLMLAMNHNSILSVEKRNK